MGARRIFFQMGERGWFFTEADYFSALRGHTLNICDYCDVIIFKMQQEEGGYMCHLPLFPLLRITGTRILEVLGLNLGVF